MVVRAWGACVFHAQLPWGCLKRERCLTSCASSNKNAPNAEWKLSLARLSNCTRRFSSSLRECSKCRVEAFAAPLSNSTRRFSSSLRTSSSGFDAQVLAYQDTSRAPVRVGAPEREEGVVSGVAAKRSLLADKHARIGQTFVFGGSKRLLFCAGTEHVCRMPACEGVHPKKRLPVFLVWPCSWTTGSITVCLIPTPNFSTSK